jgi:hypothetical protein
MGLEVFLLQNQTDRQPGVFRVVYKREFWILHNGLKPPDDALQI